MNWDAEMHRQFYLLFERKSEFSPKLRNSGFTFLCQHGTSHTTYYTSKLPKSYWFFLIGMTSIYKNYNSFEFHDVILTKILGSALTFASNNYQTASFLIPGGHLNKKSPWYLGCWQVQQSCLRSFMLAQENPYHVTIGLLVASARTANKIHLNSSESSENNERRGWTLIFWFGTVQT